MPRSYQIIPKNSYPTEEVYVNDNTTVTTTTGAIDNSTNILLVVSSPKGVDGVIQTITGGQSEFLDKIGLGPFSIYGQPLLTAYAAASTGRASVHVLRVAADDSTYACVHICAKYKVEEGGATTIQLFAVPSAAPLTNKNELAESYVPSTDPDAEGFTEVKLFSVACKGRGVYGNNYRVRLTSLTQADRENNFKNYAFEVYENEDGLDFKESFQVCFSENAVIGTTSYFADSVIMAPGGRGSEYIEFVSYPESFAQIVAAYNAANLDSIFTVDDFDPFLNIDKYTRQAIPNLTIDTTTEDTIAINDSNGIPLVGGDDGALATTVTAEERATTLEALYKKAYGGEIDPMIASKNKFPTTILPDANFSADVKKLLISLNTKRTDSILLLDAGTTITTKSSVVTWVKENLGAYSNDTYEMIDAYCGKVRDPYNQKIVTVTSSYALTLAYIASFYSNGTKHVPLADNTWGNLDNYFIEDTIYPVFDEDIDSDLMNELVEERINFARNNAIGETNRATQTTRQPNLSVLSEGNNVFIIKDIKRGCERMCARNRYQFSEAADLARFNSDAALFATQFTGQVASISAQYGQSEYEALYSIVHLYVELVTRGIVKTTIIEIDVNRA